MPASSLPPWLQVRSTLDHRFPDARPRLLVLDDYQAKYLQQHLEGYEVEGLYSYLSRRAGFSIASALDIYESFQASLHAVLPEASAMPFLEGWEYASNFSEDHREILLGLRPHEKREACVEPLLAVWQSVSQEKDLQALFALDRDHEDIPWARVLQLPRAYTGPTIRALYEKISDLAKKFLYNLWQERKAIGEELFINKPLGEKVVLWNIFSCEKRIREWIQYQVSSGGAEMWGWDMSRVQACIGAPVWPAEENWVLPSAERRISPWAEREICLRNGFRSRTELLEVVAEEIVDAYRRGYMVGMWMGEATAMPLLEEILRERGFEGPALMPPTLSQTRTGRFLQKAYQEGRVPPPEKLPQWEEGEEAERQAHRLYDFFYKAAGANNLTAFMQFLRFLDRLPSPLPWPAPPPNFISGRLAQLAGLAYERLFIILPSREPLGSWFRPSFLPAPIRRRWYPLTYRTHTAWRLLTLLLYGARETHIYQLAGEENQSPLEDFLIYLPRKYPCLTDVWTIRRYKEATPASPRPSLSSSAIPVPLPHNSVRPILTGISPSDLYDFLICPRRYYLQRVAGIPRTAVSQEAFLGSWLHEGVRVALVGTPPGSHSLLPRRSQTLFLKNLATLERLLAPRRLYRILRSVYHFMRRRDDIPKLPPLSQAPEMRFWHRLWAESGRIFYGHISRACMQMTHTSHLLLYPEVWIGKSIAPDYEPTLQGRMDLLITTEENTPLLALDYKTGALSRNLGKLAEFLSNWEKTLEWIERGKEPPKQEVRSIDLQAFAYVMNFPASFMLITASAISESNYTEYKVSDDERSEVRRLWKRSFCLVRNRWIALCEALPGATEEKARQLVEVLFPMTPEESNCRYCAYKLLCQRL